MNVTAGLEPEVVVPASAPLLRPAVRGKFLFAGDAKLYLRGTTYGTFALDQSGDELRDPVVLERDFEIMGAQGFNAVRTYTVPPPWMLDAAQRCGLRVLAGLPWQEHVEFLNDAGTRTQIEQRLREGVRRCAGHPAILGYAVGNEIPGAVVRWLGRRGVERFIEKLCRIARDEDPGALVTYVNYPTTEYLQLPFLDFVSFNVYLETQRDLSAYLARLQNLAGHLPLVMAEIGLDSRRNGEQRQAQVLDWQLRTIFASGCAGAFVYAWTDEWHRGGYPILDWDFGLTRRDGSAKPALAAVAKTFAAPWRPDAAWPSISVIVCAYNAQSTIRQCLEGLARVDYPDFEVIVVDDGSTDATGAIAAEYAGRLITTRNRGLSNARNTGLHAATGEIVAYLDSDAYPDSEWLKYLAMAFTDSGHAGVGGPNVAPPALGEIAGCFDNAPGGPTHVLLSDREAEHIPGCNMAFRRERLVAIGGFDPDLRVAGDDVDVCWRLQARGWTLGFSHAALVWHHRRTTLRSYWRQQRGYGRAEALLERKWPEKYNAFGHTTWGGRIYAKGVPRALALRRHRIYQGTWGSAPFQTLERSAPALLPSLALMPEWYLVIAALAGVCALGALWTPLLWALPLLAAAIALPFAHAAQAARQATFEIPLRSRVRALRSRGLVAFLHLAGPLARLAGRIEYGLTCWRSPGSLRFWSARPHRYALWNERARSVTEWLEALERRLLDGHAIVLRGGAYDRWDLEVRTGALGFARLLALLEEHGGGTQLARFRTWASCSLGAVALVAAFCAPALAAGLEHAWAACAIFAAVGLSVAVRTAAECTAAMERFDHALRGLHEILDRQR